MFPLGRTVATPGALDALSAAGASAATLLARHARGDWGDVCRDDHHANEQALIQGARLLSVYRLRTGEKIWVITEADRSSTTLLMPSDY